MHQVKCGIRAQSAVEYLLLLALVAILVFAAMRPGGVADQVQTAARSYYNDAAKKIKNTP